MKIIIIVIVLSVLQILVYASDDLDGQYGTTFAQSNNTGAVNTSPTGGGWDGAAGAGMMLLSMSDNKNAQMAGGAISLTTGFVKIESDCTTRGARGVCVQGVAEVFMGSTAFGAADDAGDNIDGLSEGAFDQCAQAHAIGMACDADMTNSSLLDDYMNNSGLNTQDLDDLGIDKKDLFNAGQIDPLVASKAKKAVDALKDAGIEIDFDKQTVSGGPFGEDTPVSDLAAMGGSGGGAKLGSSAEDKKMAALMTSKINGYNKKSRKALSLALGGGGGGGGSAMNFDFKRSKYDPFKDLMKKFGKKGRSTASVKGKTKLYGGAPIGVKMDNLFEMVHRRYERKRNMKTFVYIP
jgi:hypothetical protein